MSNSIHGHNIIRLVHESPSPLTREELSREVAERFGSDVRFHACDGGGMTLKELLEFLAQRGKVVEVDGYLRSDIGLMCDHEE